MQICQHSHLVPEPTYAMQQLVPLFDDLVGAREQHWRYGEAERLGCLEVDDELQFGRRLHWQIARSIALQDTIHVPSSAPKLVDEIRAIGKQTAAGGIKARVVDSRQSVSSGQSNNELAMY